MNIRLGLQWIGSEKNGPMSNSETIGAPEAKAYPQIHAPKFITEQYSNRCHVAASVQSISQIRIFNIARRMTGVITKSTKAKSICG